MNNKVFYKKRLISGEEGLIVVTDRYTSVHETPCFHYCVLSSRRMGAVLKCKDETELQYYRRTKLLRRISKTSSRIAFSTEEKALEHLKLLKRKQLSHMERETKFIREFLAADTLEKDGRYSIVPGSQELVNEYYVFD